MHSANESVPKKANRRSKNIINQPTTAIDSFSVDLVLFVVYLSLYLFSLCFLSKLVLSKFFFHHQLHLPQYNSSIRNYSNLVFNVVVSFQLNYMPARQVLCNLESHDVFHFQLNPLFRIREGKIQNVCNSE